MKESLLKIYKSFEASPDKAKLVLFVCLAIMLVAVFKCARFSEDIGAFLPKNEKTDRIVYAYQHLNTTNKIVVFIASKDSTKCNQDTLCSYVDQFVEELKKNDTTHLTSDIFYKVSTDEITEMSDFIVENLPYFMGESDYKRLDTLLADTARLRNELVWTRDLLYSPTGGMLQNMLVNDPLHISAPILKNLQNAHQKNTFQQHNGYVFDKEGKEAIVTLTSLVPSTETMLNKQWIAAIDKSAHSIEKNGCCSISHIGASDISISNADQIKTDTIVTSVLALVLIIALLLYFFRDLRSIVLLLFSIAFGALMALALLSVCRENISVIAVGIGSIIVGIAANYPLHFLAHLREGKTREETMKEIASPLIIGNITTVGAFLSITFINSTAMEDMGIFAAVLLVGTIIFVLVFMPHLFKKSLFKQPVTEEKILTKFANFALEENKYVVLAVVILTIPLAVLSMKTSFDADLHKINYMTDAQRTELQKLIAQTNDTLQKTYFVCEGTNKEETLQTYESVRQSLDSICEKYNVKRVSGISCFSPSQNLKKERVEKWNRYWSENKEKASALMRKEGSELGLSQEFFSAFITKIDTAIDESVVPDFSVIEKTLTDLYVFDSDEKCLVYTTLSCEKDSTEAMQTALNQLTPKAFSFDDKFLFDEMLEGLSADFNLVLFICAFIVFFFLWFSFGRIELTLIAMVPLTVAWFWILGLMDLFDIRFNIVNIILATFIFGQGDDYTIFVTEGLMYEYAHKKKVLASYKRSVALSSLIMFIGIGALIFAKHPALKSLAEVTIVGMSSVILMTYLFPPLLFKWLTMNGKENRIMPITLSNLLKTIMSFSVFIFFSLIYTVAGFGLLVIGGKSEANKLRFHRMISWIFRKFAQWMPGVEYHVENRGNYNFEKPSILICNHQSHLDLMYTLLLNPKIICLTNKWVWNCPFYGNIIRFAEYYPISNGIEESIETLQSAIDRGYSILIFPEGTRSETGQILRFHQGAFHLAQKFNVDVVPILIHGINHVFPKKEFLLRKGRIDVRVLPAITSENEMIKGKDPRKASQAVHRYYIEQYAKISDEIETAAYFQDYVYHQYLYKGAEVAKVVKKNLSLQSTLEWVDSLPNEGEITVNDCGYGEKTLLAALVKKHLHIIATDSDEEKISMARNCGGVPSNLEYQIKS